MRIAGSRLTNWLRFKGTHELEFGPGVYAVVAEYEGEPGRSNWGGKSAFVNAIRFALFGTVPTDTLDEAIHHGEAEMAVEHEFDDGVFVARSKVRGKPVQLEAVFPDGHGGELELTQEAAQARIVEWLRMSEADFLDTSFFEQREAARFVLAKPADRTEIVNAWFRLDPLKKAAEYAARQLADVLREQETVQREVAGLEARFRGDGFESFDEQVEAREVQLAQARAEFEERTKARREWEERQAAAREQRAAWEAAERERGLRVRLEADIAGLEKQREQLAAEPVQAVAQADLDRLAARAEDARVDVATASADVTSAKRVLRGKFDGRCPVNGCDCPVADDINADEVSARELYEDKSAVLDECGRRRDAADVALREAQSKNREAERVSARRQYVDDQLVEYREQLAGLGVAAELAETPAPPADRPLEPDAMGVARAEHALEQAREDRDHAARAREDLEEQSRLLAAWRVAAVILGRQGAQRRIAEGQLKAIERAACARLASAGIPLTVECQWGREVNKPETTCTVCGEQYAPRTKKCARCARPRGKQTDGKLHLVLSDRSGAAEDLGGLAFQLAAARWLRARRGSPWSVVVLDEPFGALDDHNRRALASSLGGLLAEGFDQAFVIAHDRGTLDALPNRVRVVARETHSELELG